MGDKLFEGKASWLFSTFLFFLGSILLHQIQSDWPLIYYYPVLLYHWAGSLSLTGWKTHLCFQLKDMFLHFPALLYERRVHGTKTSLRFYDAYMPFSVVRVIWVSSVRPGAHIICSEWLPGIGGSQRRAASTSFLCSLAKSLRSQVDEDPWLILPIRTFCNIPWSDCNLIDLPAPPLDLIRSTLSPTSQPMEVDNRGRATINCLLCAALTCAVWGRDSNVCVCICVCVWVLQGLGVSGSLCNLASRQVQLEGREKNEREGERQQNEGSKCCFSTFTSLCFTILPKQVNRGCRRRWQLFGWQIHWRKLYWKERENEERRGGSSTAYHRHITALSYLQYSGIQNVMECCVCKEDTVAHGRLLLLIIVVHCRAIKKPSTDSQLITYSVI